jgi:hypothetical protein
MSDDEAGWIDEEPGNYIILINIKRDSSDIETIDN